MISKEKNKEKSYVIICYIQARIFSGASGFTSTTAWIKSFITLSPDFFPAALMPSSWDSASLFASSSAFLFPLECCCVKRRVFVRTDDMLGSRVFVVPYLGLEFLKFFLLLFPVFVDFALCFCSSFLYSLCAVWCAQVSFVSSVLALQHMAKSRRRRTDRGRDVHSLAIIIPWQVS